MTNAITSERFLDLVDQALDDDGRPISEDAALKLWAEAFVLGGEMGRKHALRFVFDWGRQDTLVRVGKALLGHRRNGGPQVYPVRPSYAEAWESGDIERMSYAERKVLVCTGGKRFGWAILHDDAMLHASTQHQERIIRGGVRGVALDINKALLSGDIEQATLLSVRLLSITSGEDVDAAGQVVKVK